ncbi:hypothetical protein CSA56_04835 [candidate division KSB3 bacterium]|uniref:Major facilitator superfamily (MFS) profile domain-containing protein n=1 Tax=candidate division KSB3 bacterium TaxID=2044937 RepID=A0A2G6KHX8_9BACT|nr:MAG: hypothetical protein CSA56_04835 [candidate division KSB3 bacterium]
MERWKRNLIFLWVAQFFSLSGFSFSLPFGPFYLEELGITDPARLRIWSGLFASSAGLSMAIMTPFWGYLADRIGKKPMTLRASLGGTIALLGIGLAQSPEMVIAFRVLQGAFTGTVTAYLTLVIAETPKARLGLVMGLMNAAVFLGNSVAPLLGGLFADAFGYRSSFFVAAGFLLASFLLALLFVQEDFSPGPKTSFSFFSDTKSLLLVSGVLPIVGMIFLYGIARTIQRPILPLFVQQLTTTGQGVATQTGLVTSAAGIASVVAGILFGTLADRGKPMTIGMICTFAAAFMSGTIVLSETTWHLTILYFLADFAIGGLEPILKLLLARIVPVSQRGSAFGIIGSARAFGWFTGSLSGGIIAAFLGLSAVFVVTAGLFMFMGLLLSLFRRQKKGLKE